MISYLVENIVNKDSFPSFFPIWICFIALFLLDYIGKDLQHSVEQDQWADIPVWFLFLG